MARRSAPSTLSFRLFTQSLRHVLVIGLFFTGEENSALSVTAPFCASEATVSVTETVASVIETVVSTAETVACERDAVAFVTDAVAPSLETVASTTDSVACVTDSVASSLERVASTVETVASLLETVASQKERVASVRDTMAGALETMACAAEAVAGWIARSVEEEEGTREAGGGRAARWVPLAEGPSIRVALSRSLSHGSTERAIHLVFSTSFTVSKTNSCASAVRAGRWQMTNRQ